MKTRLLKRLRAEAQYQLARMRPIGFKVHEAIPEHVRCYILGRVYAMRSIRKYKIIKFVKSLWR